ncbi:MAG TPA: FHA domain-containing protein [Thermoleophilaceae bacterium]|nr:FHA domain-containing protein [Thermoleophilaceae bacterium]
MSDPDPVTLLLKFGFLAVLYLFLFWVARSALRDMGGSVGEKARPEPAGGLPEDRASRRESGMDLRDGIDPRLVVVAAMGQEPRSELAIGDSATLGRSSSADIRVDDPFASSAHARIFPRGQFMYIEDMGSTNGTYLNGRQLRQPERLKVSDTVRIGDTEYRYEE